VATTKPMNAKSVGKKFDFEYCASDPTEILNDSQINTIFVATRHDSHAKYVVEGLRRGKNVFVEKPLAINRPQLDEIIKTYASQQKKHHTYLAVGFNRRFSKPFRDIKEFFRQSNEPFMITYRVHAGFMPLTHWMQEPAQAGRIIGEGCHFIDSMMFLTDAKPSRVYAESIPVKNLPTETNDNVNVNIKFSDGSVGNLLYLANGDTSVEKEYCEVYSAGKTAILNDFAEVIFYDKGKKKKTRYDHSKGHTQEIDHFLNVILGKPEPQLSFESMCDATTSTFRIMESLQRGIPA
jgi:polar amino acid transport system substrate-binding protein